MDARKREATLRESPRQHAEIEAGGVSLFVQLAIE